MGDENTCALAQLGGRLGRGEGDACGEGSRTWVGCRREFTDTPVEAFAWVRPQLHADALAHGKTGKLLLGQADDHLTLAVCGQGEHGLPGRDHLADFDLALGDDTGLRRTQHCVLGLVAGHIELGLGLFQAGHAGAVQVFGIVVLRVADHLPVQQLLVAITLGAHQRQVGFGGGHLGTIGFQLQAHILWVQLGQRLLGLDPLALFDQAFADFAGNAEGQLRFEARAHFAGVAVGSRFGRLWLNHQCRARRGRWRGFLAARRKEQGDGSGQSDGQGMAQHDESFREEHIEYLYWRVY
ncbi:hypothetical protein D3C76_722380 [compost metagenome]